MEKIKKTLTIIIICLTLLFVNILQFTVFQKFAMFNIIANIIIVFFVFLSTYTNKIFAYILALIYGMLIDIRYSSPVGITAFALIILIELTIKFNLLLYVNSRIATMIKIFLLTIIFEFIRYLLRVIVLSFDMEIFEFIKIVIVEAIFNMFILMAIYDLFRNLGEITDEIFNKKNILSRYF